MRERKRIKGEEKIQMKIILKQIKNHTDENKERN